MVKTALCEETGSVMLSKDPQDHFQKQFTYLLNTDLDLSVMTIKNDLYDDIPVFSKRNQNKLEIVPITEGYEIY